MTINTFIQLLGQHPWAIIALLLNFGVVFVNGWTDGPNAIATVVTTRTLRPRIAIIMCAILNALGVVIVGLFSSYIAKIMGGDVSSTIASLVEWGNSSIDQVLCAIACGLTAIIVVSLICTFLGFPSSQSNCLIGGITGAGLALMALGNMGTIGLNPWIKVLVGFFGSLILGFLLGYGITLLIQLLFRKVTKGKSTRFFNIGQIVTSGLMSLMHGIQDGAKFIGVSILIASMLSISSGNSAELGTLISEWWVYVPVMVFITAGTLMGGRKIIKTMGRGVADLKKYQAFATDIAASIGLLLATLFGLPVSTGTVKSTAIMGGGAAKSFRRVKWPVAGRMIAWGALAFPISIAVGFILVMIFIWTVK